MVELGILGPCCLRCGRSGCLEPSVAERPSWHSAIDQLKLNVQRLEDGADAAVRAGDDLRVTMLLAGVSAQLKAVASYLENELARRADGKVY